MNNYFTLNTDTRNRGRSMKLFKERSRLNISKFFILNELLATGTAYMLPDYMITAESINSFKNRLDNYWTITGYGYLQRPLA